MRRTLGNLLLAACVACIVKPFAAPYSEVISDRLLVYSAFHEKNLIWFIFAGVLLVVGLVLRGRKPEPHIPSANEGQHSASPASGGESRLVVSEPPLLPVLRSMASQLQHPSAGRYLCLGAATRNVWVSFHYELGMNVILESKGDAVALERRALENLAQLPFHWEAISKDEQGRARTLLCRHEYASEGLLLESFLKEGHRLLGASRLLAAVPIRGALMVCGDTSAPEVLALFEYAKDLFNQAEEERVCETPILVENGRVLGISGQLELKRP